MQSINKTYITPLAASIRSRVGKFNADDIYSAPCLVRRLKNK